MSRIDELRGELSALVKDRARIIQEAENLVREANRDFDARARAINREIQTLLPTEPAPAPASAPARPRRARKVNLTGTADWTPEELRHYQELMARR